MSDEKRRKIQDLQAERERLIRAEDSLVAGPPPKPAHTDFDFRNACEPDEYTKGFQDGHIKGHAVGYSMALERSKPAHVIKTSTDRAGKTAAAELEYLRLQLETTAQDFGAAKLENERLRKCLVEAERIANAWFYGEDMKCIACGYLGERSDWYHKAPDDGRPICVSCHEPHTSRVRDDIEVDGMAERLINTFGIDTEAV